MSEAVSGFAALLQLSDKMLARAERQDLVECIPLLAVYCAEYRLKFPRDAGWGPAGRIQRTYQRIEFIVIEPKK